MAFDAGAIVARLELNDKAWQQAISRVTKDKSLSGYVLRNQQAIQSLGKTFAIAGAGIVGSLGAMVVKGAKYGDMMDEVSQKTGVAIGVLSGLKLAADKDGTSIEGLAMGLKGLSGKIVEANSGSKDAIALFGSLGVSVTDATGNIRPMKDVLFDTATAFSRTEDGAVKTKTAVDLFGRAGMEMIPLLNRGADGLEREWKEAERLGLVLDEKTGRAASDFNDQLENLKGSMMGVAVQMGQALMPTIQKLIATLTSVIAGVRAWAAEHPGLAALLSKVALAVGALGMALGPVLMILPKLIQTKILLKTILPQIAAGLKNIHPAQLAVNAVWLVAIGLTINYIAKLSELRDAEKEVEAANVRFADSQRTLSDRLSEASVAAGWQYGKMQELVKAHAGNLAVLGMEIAREKHGIEIKKALANAWEEYRKKIGDTNPLLNTYISIMQKAGVETFTNKEKIKGLNETILKLDKAYKDGRISLDEYKEGTSATKKQIDEISGAADKAKEANEKWIEYIKSTGITTLENKKTKIAELTEWLKRLNELHAKGGIDEGNYRDGVWKTNEEIKKLNITIIDAAVPGHRELGDVLSQLPPKLDDVAYSGKMTSYWFGVLCESMKTTKATGWLFTADLVRMAAAWKGIQLPDPLPPKFEESKEKIKSIWQEISTIVSDACKSIASSIVEAFGIQKALTYKAKEFDKSYYENLKKLAEDAYDATKKLIQDQVDAVKKAYDTEVGLIRDKFEAAKGAAARYYEELEKGARKSSEVMEQAFKKYYDGLILEINRTYDRQEVIYGRQAENEERRYSRQYEDQERAYGRRFEREKKAIENSEMTEKEKQAAILALEREYEAEKIRRERAYEDAKVQRERQRENEKIQREIQKENRLAQLQERARQKEYQLQVQLQNRLEQLARQRENRERQLDKQKESRERAAERRREAAEKALQDRLLALQATHDAQVEALRKAEDAAREKHARDEERRQNSLWNKVKGIFANAIEQMATVWLTRLIAGIIPSFDLIGNKAKDTFGEGGIVGTVKTATSSIGSIITSLASTIGTVLTTLATAVGAVITTLAAAIATGIVSVATAIAGAVVALATGIATAATALAAAAPALVVVGLIATGVYAATKLLGALLGGSSKQTDVTYWLKPISERAQEIRDWLFINAQERLNFLNIQIADLKVVLIAHIGDRLMALTLQTGKQLQTLYQGINPYLRVMAVESGWLAKIHSGIIAMVKALTSKHTIYVRDEILTAKMGEASQGIKTIAKPISGPLPFSTPGRPISGPIPGRTIGFDDPNRPISGPVPHDDPKPKPKPMPIPIEVDTVTWLKRIHARVANISNILVGVFTTPTFGTQDRPISGPIPGKTFGFGGPGGRGDINRAAGANVNITFNISSIDSRDTERFINDRARPTIIRTIQRAFKTRELHVPASAVGGS